MREGGFEGNNPEFIKGKDSMIVRNLNYKVTQVLKHTSIVTDSKYLLLSSINSLGRTALKWCKVCGLYNHASFSGIKQGLLP